MNILITGASGTVGLATLNELIKDTNNNIVAFDLLSSKQKLKKYSDKVQLVYGSLTNSNDTDKVAQNIDVVIHLAAVIPPLADQKPELANNVNVTGTENLINSIKKYSHQAMFIYCSSISVYGDRLSNKMINVGDELIPSEGDEYAKTKIAAEKLVMRSSLKWSIFRLTAVFGVKNHKINKIMFHMPLQTPMEIITPEDAGRAFAFSVNKTDELNGRIFNLSGGEKCRISYKRFLEISFDIMGMGKIKFPGIAFADRNFHCAYYADGDKLEEILNFRTDTVESYFGRLKKRIKPVFRFTVQIVSPLIKLIMLQKSEPLLAIKKGKPKEIRRFFGPFVNSSKFERVGQ